MYRVMWADGDASDWFENMWEAVEVAVKVGDDSAMIYEQEGYRPVWTWYQRPEDTGDPREW